MSTFNTLLHGSAAEAAAILSGDNPPETGATQALRAALTNALNRIDQIEKREAIQAQRRAGFDPAEL
jgi:hypothetical protein